MPCICGMCMRSLCVRGKEGGVLQVTYDPVTCGQSVTRCDLEHILTTEQQMRNM